MMKDFTYAERADMHYISGRAKGNDRAALRLYQEQFPINECRITKFFNNVRTYLIATFRTRWIGHGEDLVTRISEADALVSEIPGIFERVRQSLHRHCQACIATGQWRTQ
ncbi:hypothetical protein TNCV_616671 [Trichonephila clavipes]|nr:hypothetical protein TNCV_616671 [Trichonephila clavipes]